MKLGIKVGKKDWDEGCICNYGVPGCNDSKSPNYGRSWMTGGCPKHCPIQNKSDKKRL